MVMHQIQATARLAITTASPQGGDCFSLGADVRPDADAKLINADEFDDGVQFSQLVAAFQSSATVTVNVPSGTSAYLSAWVDYNQDACSRTLSVSPTPCR